MRFLVDECLSPCLVERLHEAGYHATHVTHIGKRGLSDQALMKVVLDGDWTLITGNAYDFRGPADSPGTSGGYSGASIHPGLVCLNRPHRDSRALQLDLLELTIETIADLGGDLVNQVLEVTLNEDDTVDLTAYELPADQ